MPTPAANPYDILRLRRVGTEVEKPMPGKASAVSAKSLSSTEAKGDDGFVRVESPDEKAPSSATTATFSAVSAERVKSMMSSALGRRPIDCLLAGKVSVTSGAGTSCVVMSPVDLTLLQDWSAFAGLYDEARCVGLDAYVGSEPSNVATNVNCWWAANFDPANSASPSTATDIVANAYHVGPFLIWNNQTTSPQPVCSTSHMPKLHVPRGGLAKPLALGSSTSAALVGGDWFPTSATSAIAGYLKAFSDALGGSVTNTIALFVVAHVQFRARS